MYMYMYNVHMLEVAKQQVSTFVKHVYRDHYTSNIHVHVIVAAPMQCCNYSASTHTVVLHGHFNYMYMYMHLYLVIDNVH